VTIPFVSPQSIAPTNNLYKFVSLFGLTLLVLSIVLNAMRIYQHNSLVAKAQVSQAVAAEIFKQNASEAQQAVNAWQAELERATLRLSQSRTQPSGTSLYDQTSAVERASNEMAAQVVKSWQSTRDTQVDQVRVSTELAVDKVLMDAKIKDFWLLTAVAAIISFVGFVGWYFRLQQPQDRLLQLQVEIRMKRLRARSSASN
jgi:hypothetical protein